MKSVYHKYIPFFLIIFIIFAFFTPLFYPKFSLFSTPDFGESDIWQLNLPLKYFLSQSLKSGQYPLWNQSIGNGFPTLAEGQIGTFNIFNLLLFRFFPFVLAYNLGYIFIFITTAIGTYLYCRTIKFSSLISFYASIIFSFSGIFITHISHFNLIQTASFLPWLFFATEKFLSSKKLLWGSIIALILSQQIFSGFPQLVFITLMGIGLYFLFSLLPLNRIKILPAFLFIIFLGIGFGASSIQLLPQKEFLDFSTRAGGFDFTQSTYFSYPLKHLLTFLLPYKLGDPRIGTYPYFTQGNGSVFWENTGYIGILPLLFAILSLKKIKRKKVLFYWLLLIISFVLMTGKYSPLYFIYGLPPFSYFRVPSRFIFLFVWSLIILSSYGFEVLKSFKFKSYHYTISLQLPLIFLSFFQLFLFSYFYNPILPADHVLQNPETSKFIKKDDRIFSFGSGFLWNRIFLKDGWRQPSNYLFFKNALLSDQNIIYNIPSINEYQAQITKRYNLISAGINTIPTDDESLTATPSAISLNLLKTYGVSKIITPYNISVTNNLKKIGEVKSGNFLPSFKIYQLENSADLFYTSDKYKKITYIEDFFNYLIKSTAEKNNTLITEKDLSNADNQNELATNIKLNYLSPTLVKLTVSSNKKAFLVYNNSFYPGWTAALNGKKTSLFPVNVNQIGLTIEKGDNSIKLQYQPKSFDSGKKISVATYILLFLFLFLQIVQFRKNFFD